MTENKKVAFRNTMTFFEQVQRLKRSRQIFLLTTEVFDDETKQLTL